VIAGSAAAGGDVIAASAEAAEPKASITPSVSLETITFLRCLAASPTVLVAKARIYWHKLPWSARAARLFLRRALLARAAVRV
jgi:hypothetical protein